MNSSTMVMDMDTDMYGLNETQEIYNPNYGTLNVAQEIHAPTHCMGNYSEMMRMERYIADILLNGTSDKEPHEIDENGIMEAIRSCGYFTNWEEEDEEEDYDY